ncbi:GNAT family N-acetyltransferase [Gordonia phthalatica]|uniref:Acetyltransferase n=1 Tax=Gordonia phthalatica TaxID=1136941 RepID=A0A0N9N9M7_9ACTN|nr:GNAT family N-acetyltransferase [Gordonia phthalatica]ALG83945.1 acetyltransferase [Gordonia phthalatica]
MPSIRPATVDDLPAVADIYRYYVENSVATFDLEPLSVAQWEAKLGRIRDAGRPFIVMEDDDSGAVLGYAYLGVYRGKAGWAHTAEDSIYLRPESAGRGLGRVLLQGLLDATDRSVTHNVMAVISDEVAASVALHRKVGFVEVGRTADVGRKFDRWLGAVYMQYAFTD